MVLIKEAELKEKIKNLGCEAIRKEDGLYIYRNNKLLLLFTNDYMKTHINYWEYAYFINMIPFLESEVNL
ncbi:MAG: hypothetical protein KBS82_05095 [Oscillospiraceae bacterium]|nr:hypothetical protein [Candidatus Limimonas egerieequi]